MATQKPQKKFLDKFILTLVIACMVLIVTHQINNLVDYNTPEATATQRVTNSNQYVVDGEIKDEDILEDWFTPTPNHNNQNPNN
ncbi:MAG: hypothetical protein HOF35_14150 [Bacteroidetes bacterium]|jgi:hypothetical protein|nr:hypothetical protein [Chloroflexota bacterium]MBT3935392.1 hypothetical protein [Bacteroidota bacterium]MBT4306196.1 hypothetical protein [Chloroflexota bacterium]MBT6834596.1 hypothetical protein [Bacteroidota bacterium]MBT6988455.1 hypothetical protein [Chloroflexota bacterium]